MTATLYRRTAAATVLAVTAASGFAPSGAVASAHTRTTAHTSLSIRAVKSAINPGGGDTVRGQLWASNGHNAGRRIVLRQHVVGGEGWTKAARHRTNRRGVVRFQVSPASNTRYQLAFRGNKEQAGSHSGTVLVRVLDTTSLVVTVDDRSIEPGDSDNVNGVLSLDGTALAGQSVNLLGAPRGQHLAPLGTELSDADGGVTFPVTPASTSRYRLSFHKSGAYKGARSAVVVIHVRRPSSLSIRARANHKKGLELINGQLRGAGHPLAHRKVTLLTRPSGSQLWTTASSKFTHRHGVVGFKVPAPTASTDYQLTFHGGPVFDGCQSGVVTVTVS
jgi:hypothetical protein